MCTASGAQTHKLCIKLQIVLAKTSQLFTLVFFFMCWVLLNAFGDISYLKFIFHKNRLKSLYQGGKTTCVYVSYDKY